ncbi:hypothetical protein [Rhodoplanes roseus]|uniref:hypothetical protein n=1 Tax=Rhodoplanes roseus TaxID=29409 RepID=UPI0011B36D9B|nr:hypothetical protein [Rhodoplanes roseus]
MPTIAVVTPARDSIRAIARAVTAGRIGARRAAVAVFASGGLGNSLVAAIGKRGSTRRCRHVVAGIRLHAVSIVESHD